MPFVTLPLLQCDLCYTLPFVMLCPLLQGALVTYVPLLQCALVTVCPLLWCAPWYSMPFNCYTVPFVTLCPLLNCAFVTLCPLLQCALCYCVPFHCFSPRIAASAFVTAFDCQKTPTQRGRDMESRPNVRIITQPL